MAWRFKIIVLYITLFVIGILLVEELITYTVKLPKYGYRKESQFPQVVDNSNNNNINANDPLNNIDNNVPHHPKDLEQYEHHKEVTESTQTEETSNSAFSATNLEIHKNSLEKPIIWNSHPGILHSEATTARSNEATKLEHAQRIDNLHKVCAMEENKRRIEQRKANLTHFYFNREHKFAYCKVPKSGSTFWMKVFMIMSRGKNYSTVVSSMSRREIHDRTNGMVVNPLHILRRNIPTVVVSRNPFSRLFSAYVDKVYLPLFWENFVTMSNVNILPSYVINSTIEVLKNTNKPLSGRLARYRDSLRAKGMLYLKNVTRLIQPICVNNASFEDFLKFIIAEVQKGHALEPHWAPISHLCHPCRFNIQNIVKQETFSSDVEHTLSSIGINLDEFDWLKSSLRENRVQNSAPGIVAVVDFKLKQRSIKRCISPKEAVTRLWKAFQIQGFISRSVDIPKEVVDTRTFRKDEFTEAVLNAVKHKPMTSSESRKQRQEYLVEAYRGISEETLSAIQQIYYLDFALFNYPFSPPM